MKIRLETSVKFFGGIRNFKAARFIASLKILHILLLNENVILEPKCNLVNNQGIEPWIHIFLVCCFTAKLIIKEQGNVGNTKWRFSSK